MAKAKFIGEVGPFEIWKAGHVLIVHEDGEFSCSRRKSDPGFHDPIAYYQSIIAARAEHAADHDAARRYRQAAAAEYLAARRDRVARQPMFAF